jgi:hypothetical protein
MAGKRALIPVNRSLELNRRTCDLLWQLVGTRFTDGEGVSHYFM